MEVEGEENKGQDGLVPRVSAIIDNFDKYIVWEGPKRNIPTPQQGHLKEYDSAKAQLQGIRDKL